MDKKKLTDKDISNLFRKIDPKDFWGKVVWQLNVPRCSDELCYKAWLEQGKEIYGKDNEGYRRAVEKEEFHRQQRRLQPGYSPAPSH
jgi:hypothetical protein